MRVARDSKGDIIVLGITDNRGSGWDMLTIKYSGADGSVVWQHRYNGPGNVADGGHDVVVDRDNNVIVTGNSGNGTNTDCYTAKYAAADGALIWEKIYNGPANSVDGFVAVVVDGSGDVVATGTSSSGEGTNDFYTAKYASADGALLWEQRYNGPANGDDKPQAMVLDADGNVMVTGYSVGNGSSYDYFTIKYASHDGAMLWEHRYDGPANAYDSPRALAVDSNGNVVVTGYSRNRADTAGSDGSDFYTAKYAAVDGALLWDRRYNGPVDKYDAAWAVAVDSSGNVVVAGASEGSITANESYTAKYAANDGELLWEKRSTNSAYFMDMDSSGNVVVTGTIDLNNNRMVTTAKYASADGAILWQTNHWQGLWPSLSSIVVNGDGEVVVAGTLQSTSHKDHDWFMVNHAADGTILWQNRYDGKANAVDSARDIAMDSDGNVVVTGTTVTAKYAAANGALLWKQPGANAVAIDRSGNVVLARDSIEVIGNFRQIDFSTAKYSANGDLIWEQLYDGPAGSSDRTKAIAVDLDGNVVVTGESYNGGTSGNNYAADFYTAKYAAADGALLWERRYNSPTNRYDSPKALAVGADGNVVVTGDSHNGINSGFYTAKYGAADGALLWERSHDGLTNTDAMPSGVAVDRSGNVIVTGYSYTGTNSDFYTAKYAAIDGDLIWEKRYNGPANSSDGAASVAVDEDDNVFVTGNSKGFGGAYDYDYYTAKYAAADGALLWEKRYNSPTNGSDYAVAVAVDEIGNVVVTGASNAEYYTAMYGAADGALLWEQRQSMPPNRLTHVVGLALGPGGMVAVAGHFYTSFVDGVLADFDYMTVVYREDLPWVFIEREPLGVRLRFVGNPDQSYKVQRAGIVTGPWDTIATRTAPLDGAVDYLDSSPLPGMAFYRISFTR